MDSPRWWTVAEANQALAWLTEQVMTMRQLIDEARAASRRAGEALRSNGHGALPADLAPIQQLVDALRAEGIVLRDLDQGLLDFPARTETGNPYLLCWIVGEPEVAWWHWPEDGFAGRTPLAEPPR